MRVKLSVALSVLAAVAWAVPGSGAARLFARPAQVSRSLIVLPQPIRFRVDRDRGLLVTAWINDRGPFTFVIDTGAGLNVVSERVVLDAALKITTTNVTPVGGLSGALKTSNQEVVFQTLALGYQTNIAARNKQALVVTDLPPGVDGILDPTDTFAPLGYSLDFPRQQLAVLDDSVELTQHQAAEDAVVEWLRRDDARPFVKLGDGRVALIDTGSRFGLAISDRQARVVSNRRPHIVPTSDIGGGIVNARRVDPTNISIGELVLRGIPTDIISGAAADAPIILGRDALYPFKIIFDPRHRLIAFAESQR